MSMKAKAFVCLHGFGNHSGGHRPGFSAALRRAVEARLGAKTVWKEVLWDGLLGSSDSSGTLDRALPSPALARAFYEGREGDAVRARVAEAVRAAAAESGGAPVVLVGHSFGAAIAYETLARGLAPEAKSLVMLAPPMGLFNRPEMLAAHAIFGMPERREAAAARGRLGPGAVERIFNAFAAPIQAVAGLPEVKGDRLPDDVSALSLRSPEDGFAETLEPDFPDVSEREVLPPPGTRRGANHRFYWKSPDVAESVAAAAVAACSQAGEPPATAEAFELLSRAVEDSLWSAGEEFEFDEDGNIVGVSVS